MAAPKPRRAARTVRAALLAALLLASPLLALAPVAGATALRARASVSDSTPGVGDTVSFDGSSSTGASSLYWNFKDGDTASGVTVSRSFSSAGSYNVTLTAVGADGSSDTAYVVVTVTSADNAAPAVTPTAQTAAIASGTPGTAVQINATVTDNTGLSAVRLYYRLNSTSTSFTEANSTAMSVESGDVYTADIPASAVNGSSILWAIKATDSSSNVAWSPENASGGSTGYAIALADAQGPTITRTHAIAGTTTWTTQRALTVRATVTDDSGVASATLNVAMGASGSFAPLAMSKASNSDEWSATVPVSTMTVSSCPTSGSTLSYFLQAQDEANNTGSAGSSSSPYTITVSCSDQTAPVSTATVDGVERSNGDSLVSAGDFNVSLAATDDTGVAATLFTVDQALTNSATTSTAGVRAYAAAFLLSAYATADGQHVLRFFSRDSSGSVNNETVQQLNLTLDTAAPTTALSAVATSVAGGGATVLLNGGSADVNSTDLFASSDIARTNAARVLVTLAASDATSGVSVTYYTLDGTDPLSSATRRTYTAPFNVTTAGETTIAYASVDAAGNQGAVLTRVLALDDAQPVLTAPRIAAGGAFAAVFFRTDEPAATAIRMHAGDGTDFSADADHACATAHALLHACTLSGLTPDTLYSYQVRATDRTGNGPRLGDAATFTATAAGASGSEMQRNLSVVGSGAKEFANSTFELEDAFVPTNAGVGLRVNTTAVNVSQFGGLDVTLADSLVGAAGVRAVIQQFANTSAPASIRNGSLPADQRGLPSGASAAGYVNITLFGDSTKLDDGSVAGAWVNMRVPSSFLAGRTDLRFAKWNDTTRLIITNATLQGTDGAYRVYRVWVPGFSVLAAIANPGSGSSGGGGGGGGSGGSGGSAGAAGTAGSSQPAVVSSGGTSTATASVTAPAGGTVSLALAAADPALGTLTLVALRALSGAPVQVEVARAPLAGAPPLAEGYQGVRYLDVRVPAGVGSGSLTFTLAPADLAGRDPRAAVLLHAGSAGWAPRPTALLASDGSGASYRAELDGFSPFAIAFDTAPPTVADVWPSDKAVTGARPPIGARLSDARGLDAAATRLLLDGQTLPAALDGSTISYTPPEALAPGAHTAVLQTVDLSGLAAGRSWTFQSLARDDAQPPAVQPLAPPPQGFARGTQPVIAAALSDDVGVDEARVQVLLDGQPLFANANGTGVTAIPAAALAEGLHRAEVRAPDGAGHVTSLAWTFTVDATPPAVAPATPADGSAAGPRPRIEASLRDALSGIDTASATMTLDGQRVEALAWADAAAYNPPADLAPGRHVVAVRAMDQAGNEGSATWSFTVGSEAAGSRLPLLAGGAIALAAAAGAGVVLWRRRAG